MQYQSAGQFFYAQNIAFGYALVHVTEEMLRVEYRASSAWDVKEEKSSSYFSIFNDFTGSLRKKPEQNEVLFTVEIERTAAKEFI